MQVYDTPFAAASLRQLGLGAEQIVRHDACAIHRADWVVAPVNSGGGKLELSREHYRMVRGAAARGVPLPPPRAAPHQAGGCAPALLLVRGQASATERSSLRNAPAVRGALDAYLPLPDGEAAAAFDPAAVPLAEQAARFGAAALVVGVEGSALANLVFMRAGAVAVSLTPTATSVSCGETCYWHIASAVGVRFWSFLLPEAAWADAEVEVPGRPWG